MCDISVWDWNDIFSFCDNCINAILGVGLPTLSISLIYQLGVKYKNYCNQVNMRENANIKIVGKNVILIPYESKHVEKYGHR